MSLLARADLRRIAYGGMALCVMAWVLYRGAELMALGWEFDQDDAFITFRYARNLVEGHGLVWNVGEKPVEGYSNFTTLLIAALALAQDNDPLFAVKVVNLISVGFTSVFMYVLGRTFVGPLAATLPAIILLSDAGQVMWTVSGLETALYQSLTVACVLCTVKALGFGSVGWSGHGASKLSTHSDAWTCAAALCALLCGMTRPDGLLVAFGCGAALLLRGLTDWKGADFARSAFTTALRHTVIYTALFGVLYGAYFAWRVWYFGRLLPNTVYCKAYWNGDQWVLLRHFWESWAFLICAALVYPLRRLDTRHAMLVGIPCLYGVALYGADPIVGQESRHFLAAIALLLVAGTAAAGVVIRAVIERVGFLREAPLVGLALLASVPVYDKTQAQIDGWRQTYVSRNAARTSIAEYVAENLPADGTFVMGDVGIVGYETRQRLIDAYCLNSREMTSPPISLSGSKYVKWVMDEDPELIVVQSRHAMHFVPPIGFCYGFYRALTEQAEFKERYTRVHQAGAGAFHYFVYKRMTAAELARHKLFQELAAKQAADNAPTASDEKAADDSAADETDSTGATESQAAKESLDE